MVSEAHVLDLIPAYALGCLDQEEEIWVAEHIARCASCRSELNAYQLVVDELPLAVASKEPPAGLKVHILQRARDSKNPAPKSNPPAWQRLFSLLRGATPVWGLASLVLFLILGLNNLYLRQRIDNLEINRPPGLMTLTLTGTEFSPDAIGTIVVSQDGDHGTLVVDGLPVLDASQQYQVWLIQDGKRTSGGVFSVDKFGYGALWINSPEPLENFNAFGVTIEPNGGSPGPTGKKVLGGGS